tara:strand:+ start:339 stop:542 length:204 start_codon:yes stop_codon:yes gene_type:complete
LTVEPDRDLRWQGVFLHKILFSGQHYFMIEPQGDDQVIFVNGENVGGIMLPSTGIKLAKVQGFKDMN